MIRRKHKKGAGSGEQGAEEYKPLTQGGVKTIFGLILRSQRAKHEPLLPSSLRPAPCSLLPAPCSLFPQSGFTIVECLMAIVVLGILMTAIAPVVALSVGNRVQSRRVELATQAARAYIDGVRAGAIYAPSHTISLNEVNPTTKQFTSQRDTFANAQVPTVGSLSCPTTMGSYPYCQNTSTSSLYCIDLDDSGCSTNSPKDLVVQAFRSVTSASTDANQGYLLGVRVYRADALKNDGSLKKTKDTNSRQATFTGGLGDRKAPLVEMTTEIVTSQTNYENLCARLGGCQ